PLRHATDHFLGRPLPHQHANPTRAPPAAINLSPVARAYAVLAEVSLGYPPQQGRFPRATHPCATPQRAEALRSVRLACVKHAASVRSEPGSNSHVNPRLNSIMDFSTTGSTQLNGRQTLEPLNRERTATLYAAARASLHYPTIPITNRLHPRAHPPSPRTAANATF